LRLLRGAHTGRHAAEIGIDKRKLTMPGVTTDGNKASVEDSEFHSESTTPEGEYRL
jgi:hypothetical protein